MGDGRGGEKKQKMREPQQNKKKNVPKQRNKEKYRLTSRKRGNRNAPYASVLSPFVCVC